MTPDKFFEALALVPNLRSARFDDLAITEIEDGFKFEGHAAVFDEPAEMAEFTESIERGAFRKVLRLPDNVPLTLEHDTTKVFATTASGTLRLREDAKGLAVEADVPNTGMSRDLKAMVERGIVHGMSFGFITGRDNQKIEHRGPGVKPHRRITGFKKLLDVCATWDPTYRSAEAQFRSLTMQYADSPEALQQLLMGAYHPQLEERATDEEEDAETPADTEAAATVEGKDESSRVDDGDKPHLAAARRRLAVMSITLKEGDLP